jgi:hypothetical protein
MSQLPSFQAIHQYLGDLLYNKFVRLDLWLNNVPLYNRV